jgi:tetratricopeptide (TPR) repeat protein
MELPANPNLDAINKGFAELLNTYALSPENLPLYIAYAEFLAYTNGLTDKGISILKQALDLSLSDYSYGLVQLKLGDMLVFNGKFNEGLIQYTQVQKRLKNDVMGQEARFKVARTSFYKGDFDWALTQLKVLRESSSQLIANDAMSLSLIISDNSLQDSTQTALKLYAKADLLAHQHKTEEAIQALEFVLSNHKGEAIEDEALLLHAELLTSIGDYSGAELSYRKIINFFGQDILADDAHYALAELYKNHIKNPAAAMEHYQSIIYNFQNSYFFPDARKKFRALRGDSIN